MKKSKIIWLIIGIIFVYGIIINLLEIETKTTISAKNTNDHNTVTVKPSNTLISKTQIIKPSKELTIAKKAYDKINLSDIEYKPYIQASNIIDEIIRDNESSVTEKNLTSNREVLKFNDGSIIELIRKVDNGEYVFVSAFYKN